MSEPSSFEPHLGPDFARRVLRAVDLQLTHRRQTRRAAFAVASLFAVVAIAGWRSGWFVMPASQPNRIAMESQDFSLPPQDGEMDALGDLFPDAAAVVSIDSQYAQRGQDGDSLFEDQVLDTQDDRTPL